MTAQKNEFTPSGIRAITEQRDAKRLVGKAVTAWRKAQDMGQSATATASYATHAAVQSGYLVTGTAGTGQVNGKDYALMFEVPPGTVTAWKALGHALVVVGIPADSTVFKQLGRGGIGHGAVTKAVFADDATPESVEAVLREFVEPDGTRIPNDKRKPEFQNNKATGRPKTGDKAPTVVEVKGTLVQQVGALVTALDKALKSGGLTIDQWQVIDARLGKIRERENTLHANASNPDAKRAATTRSRRKAS